MAGPLARLQELQLLTELSPQVSIFPKQYHAFFFVGTYSLSFCIAPFNLAIGDLSCNKITAPEAHWPRILTFYCIAACYNIFGTACFLSVCWLTSEGKRVFEAKDRDLVRRRSAARPVTASHFG